VWRVTIDLLLPATVVDKRGKVSARWLLTVAPGNRMTSEHYFEVIIAGTKPRLRGKRNGLTPRTDYFGPFSQPVKRRQFCPSMYVCCRLLLENV